MSVLCQIWRRRCDVGNPFIVTAIYFKESHYSPFGLRFFCLCILASISLHLHSLFPWAPWIPVKLLLVQWMLQTRSGRVAAVHSNIVNCYTIHACWKWRLMQKIVHIKHHVVLIPIRFSLFLISHTPYCVNFISPVQLWLWHPFLWASPAKGPSHPEFKIPLNCWPCNNFTQGQLLWMTW